MLVQVRMCFLIPPFSRVQIYSKANFSKALSTSQSIQRMHAPCTSQTLPCGTRYNEGRLQPILRRFDTQLVRPRLYTRSSPSHSINLFPFVPPPPVLSQNLRYQGVSPSFPFPSKVPCVLPQLYFLREKSKTSLVVSLIG